MTPRMRIAASGLTAAAATNASWLAGVVVGGSGGRGNSSSSLATQGGGGVGGEDAVSPWMERHRTTVGGLLPTSLSATGSIIGGSATGASSAALSATSSILLPMPTAAADLTSAEPAIGAAVSAAPAASVADRPAAAPVLPLPLPLPLPQPPATGSGRRSAATVTLSLPLGLDPMSRLSARIPMPGTEDASAASAPPQLAAAALSARSASAGWATGGAQARVAEGWALEPLAPRVQTWRSDDVNGGGSEGHIMPLPAFTLSAASVVTHSETAAAVPTASVLHAARLAYSSSLAGAGLEHVCTSGMEGASGVVALDVSDNLLGRGVLLDGGATFGAVETGARTTAAVPAADWPSATTPGAAVWGLGVLPALEDLCLACNDMGRLPPLDSVLCATPAAFEPLLPPRPAGSNDDYTDGDDGLAAARVLYPEAGGPRAPASHATAAPLLHTVLRTLPAGAIAAAAAAAPRLFAALAHLDVSHNPLAASTLATLLDCAAPTLVTLRATDCELWALPAAASKLLRLEAAHLDHNHIDDAPSLVLLSRLPRLRVLDLAHNGITALPPAMAGDVDFAGGDAWAVGDSPHALMPGSVSPTFVTAVQLGARGASVLAPDGVEAVALALRRPLRDFLPCHAFPSLTWLSLAHNALPVDTPVDTPVDVFVGMPALTYVALWGNPMAVAAAAPPPRNAGAIPGSPRRHPPPPKPPAAAVAAEAAPAGSRSLQLALTQPLHERACVFPFDAAGMDGGGGGGGSGSGGVADDAMGLAGEDDGEGGATTNQLPPAARRRGPYRTALQQEVSAALAAPLSLRKPQRPPTGSSVGRGPSGLRMRGRAPGAAAPAGAPTAAAAASGSGSAPHTPPLPSDLVAATVNASAHAAQQEVEAVLTATSPARGGSSEASNTDAYSVQQRTAALAYARSQRVVHPTSQALRDAAALLHSDSLVSWGGGEVRLADMSVLADSVAGGLDPAPLPLTRDAFSTVMISLRAALRLGDEPELPSYAAPRRRDLTLPLPPPPSDDELLPEGATARRVAGWEGAALDAMIASRAAAGRRGSRTSPPAPAVRRGSSTSPPAPAARRGSSTSPPPPAVRRGSSTSPPPVQRGSHRIDMPHLASPLDYVPRVSRRGSLLTPVPPGESPTHAALPPAHALSRTPLRTVAPLPAEHKYAAAMAVSAQRMAGAAAATAALTGMPATRKASGTAAGGSGGGGLLSAVTARY